MNAFKFTTYIHYFYILISLQNIFFHLHFIFIKFSTLTLLICYELDLHTLRQLSISTSEHPEEPDLCLLADLDNILAGLEQTTLVFESDEG